MGLVTNVLLAGGGGVVIKVISNHLLSMRQIAAQRIKDVDGRADEFTDKLSERVSELEAALKDANISISNERRECDRQLGELRGEMKAMQDKMDGLVRQLIAAQVATANSLGDATPAMRRALDSLSHVKGTGE